MRTNVARHFSDTGRQCSGVLRSEFKVKAALNMRLFPAWFHRGHIGAMSAEQSRAIAAKWEDYVTPMVYPRYIKMSPLYELTHFYQIFSKGS